MKAYNFHDRFSKLCNFWFTRFKTEIGLTTVLVLHQVPFNERPVRFLQEVDRPDVHRGHLVHEAQCLGLVPLVKYGFRPYANGSVESFAVVDALVELLGSQ